MMANGLFSEKHIQTLFGGIILIAISWTAWAVTDARTNNAVMQQQINHIEQTIIATTQNRYTSIEAAADKTVQAGREVATQAQLIEIGRRLMAIEDLLKAKE